MSSVQDGVTEHQPTDAAGGRRRLAKRRQLVERRQPVAAQRQRGRSPALAGARPVATDQQRQRRHPRRPHGPFLGR